MKLRSRVVTIVALTAALAAACGSEDGKSSATRELPAGLELVSGGPRLLPVQHPEDAPEARLYPWKPSTENADRLDPRLHPYSHYVPQTRAARVAGHAAAARVGLGATGTTPAARPLPPLGAPLQPNQVFDGGITIEGTSGADLVSGVTIENPTAGTAAAPIQDPGSLSFEGQMLMTPVSGCPGTATNNQTWSIDVQGNANPFSECAGDGNTVVPQVFYLHAENGGTEQIFEYALTRGGNFVDQSGNSGWHSFSNLGVTGGVVTPLAFARNTGAVDPVNQSGISFDQNEIQINLGSLHATAFSVCSGGRSGNCVVMGANGMLGFTSAAIYSTTAIGGTAQALPPQPWGYREETAPDGSIVKVPLYK